MESPKSISLKASVLTFFFLIIISISCARKKSISPLFDSASLNNITIEGGCGDATRIVKRVKNATGIVHYNTYDKVYEVVTYIQGTIDSQDIGFACNLPTSLRVEGMSINFDGDYIRLDRQILVPQAGGQAYYYLKLTKVTSQAVQDK